MLIIKENVKYTEDEVTEKVDDNMFNDEDSGCDCPLDQCECSLEVMLKLPFVITCNVSIHAVLPWESYRNGNFVPNRQEYFHMQKRTN